MGNPRYIELKFEGKVYKEAYKINEILIKEGFAWFIDTEIENMRLEIEKNTLIINSGTWYNGVFKYGVIRNIDWKYGIFENGVWFNGLWRNGIFKSGIVTDGKFIKGSFLEGEIRGGDFFDCNISNNIIGNRQQVKENKVYNLREFELFERSSFTKLGIPLDIMKQLQRDYEVDADAEWDKVKFKARLKEILEKNESNLFVKISLDMIYVFASLFVKGNKVYIIDRFDYNEDEEWGGTWQKKDRRVVSLSTLLSTIFMDGNIYHLKGKKFKIEEYEIRKIRKNEVDLDEFTKFFKTEAIEKFNKIVKAIYGFKTADAIEQIINNLHTINYDKDYTKRDIRKILRKDIDVKKVKKFYTQYQKEDPKQLNSDTIKDNSLTIFDEYLIRFENEMSDKLGSFFNIKSLVDKYGLDKMLTAFIYFIKTDKLMKINESEEVQDIMGYDTDIRTHIIPDKVHVQDTMSYDTEVMKMRKSERERDIVKRLEKYYLFVKQYLGPQSISNILYEREGDCVGFSFIKNDAEYLILLDTIKNFIYLKFDTGEKSNIQNVHELRDLVL